jgi:hypothetical protein
LTNKVAGLVDPQKLIAQLTASTQAMVMNTNPAWTMEQAFAKRYLDSNNRELVALEKRERLDPLTALRERPTACATCSCVSPKSSISRLKP